MQKFMNMHHALYPKRDVDKLNLVWKIEGHGLLHIQHVIEEEKRSPNDYIKRSREKLLKVVKMENILKTTEMKDEYKK